MSNWLRESTAELVPIIWGGNWTGSQYQFLIWWRETAGTELHTRKQQSGIRKNFNATIKILKDAHVPITTEVEPAFSIYIKEKDADAASNALRSAPPEHGGNFPKELKKIRKKESEPEKELWEEPWTITGLVRSLDEGLHEDDVNGYKITKKHIDKYIDADIKAYRMTPEQAQKYRNKCLPLYDKYLENLGDTLEEVILNINKGLGKGYEFTAK
jgi:hypothetical protein